MSDEGWLVAAGGGAHGLKVWIWRWRWIWDVDVDGYGLQMTWGRSSSSVGVRIK
jgi:hypothetical protein